MPRLIKMKRLTPKIKTSSMTGFKKGILPKMDFGMPKRKRRKRGIGSIIKNV